MDRGGRRGRQQSSFETAVLSGDPFIFAERAACGEDRYYRPLLFVAGVDTAPWPRGPVQTTAAVACAMLLYRRPLLSV